MIPSNPVVEAALGLYSTSLVTNLVAYICVSDGALIVNVAVRKYVTALPYTILLLWDDYAVILAKKKKNDYAAGRNI